MDMVRYGIVGCGMMGQEHIANIGLLPKGEVSCVFDPVPEISERASELAGGARMAPTLEDMVRDEAVDALVIVSPNHLHVDQLFEISKI
ncbi:MAG: Gfo/Idh/MocA family oxidoreductase, partial [Pseudomonadota bacterium]